MISKVYDFLRRMPAQSERIRLVQAFFCHTVNLTGVQYKLDGAARCMGKKS